jgi:regulator of sigma E protease
LGHFLAAKSVGVRVEKFYLGFNFFGLGWKKEYKGTEYGIGLFPLGGYVKVAGVIDESMDTEFTGGPDEFRSKNTLQKIWIMSAGVIMNFLLAILIFSHLTYHNGINEADPRAIVGQVLQEYPAESLGLQAGDEIISINGVQISDWEEMTAEIYHHPDEVLYISWQRSGIIMKGSLITESTKQFVGDEIVKQGRIGIAPLLNHRYVTLMESLKIGCERTWYFLDLTFRSLMAIIKGNVSIKELAGPITIAKIAGETASAGINALLGLMAFISINLGFINILPIPGLDGGHVLIALIEGVIRRDLPIKVKMGVQQVGLLILLMLFITIMVNDIQRLIH